MVKETARRARADSVLGGDRMDGLQDFKKLKSSQNSKWKKMRALIDKKTTKLCLIQVPKGVSKHVYITLSINARLYMLLQYKLDSELNALDLAHQMRKLNKAGRQSHTYKLASDADSSVKDTFVTLEVAGGEPSADNKKAEFTENAYQKQVLQIVLMLEDY